MKRTTRIVGATLLLCGTASVSLACELPPLVAIPAKGDVGDKGPQIHADVQKYYDAMKVYTDCIQSEITAAGGDTAPAITKAVLVQRNNSAVNEVQNVMKALQDSIGGAAPGAAPAGDAKEGGRRRDR